MLFDWTNDEEIKNKEDLDKLEFFMQNILLLKPETDVPTYCPKTNQISMSTGFSFFVPKRFSLL